MKLFNQIFLSALFSGVIAGLVLAAVQHFTVVPMILEAETYEVTEEPETSHEEQEAWTPKDGLERTFFTATSSIVIGIGFGLLLTVCYVLRKSVTWQKGILWGLAGWAVFNLAPSFGLPPELPGDAAAGLEQRQVWWILTVILTAMGLWILAFQPKPYLKIFGVALIALPHIFGAPQPEIHEGLAPQELRTAFQITTLATNAVFWIALGVLSALFFNRFAERTENSAVSATIS
jgi:cobalt transporter subunit CbtA